MGYAMRKKLTALLLACLLLVCLVLPVSAADAPALYGTANAAGGTGYQHRACFIHVVAFCVCAR